MAEQNKPTRKTESSVTVRRKKKSGAGQKYLSFFDRFIAVSKRFFSQFGAAVIAIAIVAYVFLQVMLNVGTILDTEAAAYVNISDTAEVDAFLFRDEQIVPAGVNGTSCFLAEDGEKVRRGENIAITYSDPKDVETQQRIKEIEERISILERSNLSTGASITDAAALDAQIEELVMELIRSADSNEYEAILRKKEELLILMNRRQTASQAEDYTKEIAALKLEMAQLNRSLTGASFTTSAPVGGYFYSNVDGYEESFTIERLESLTAEGFEELYNSMPDKSIIEGSAGKIILNSTWYIALAVDKRTAEGYKDGRKYPVIFQYSNNAEIEMTLERRMTRSDKDVTVLVFSTKEMPRDFDFSRCQTVELPRKDYEGIRVSTSALRMKDGQLGVYTVMGSKVVFKTTEVLYTYGSYSVCAIPTDPAYPNKRDVTYYSATRLSLHDSVIIGGEDIYDGMRVQ